MIPSSQSQTLTPLTVTQLTNAIKLNLETTFPCIHLQGEISNFKLQTSGHLYFSLKDTNAQIAAVMFKNEASYLKVMPKGGDQVIVKAELNVYPPKGNYQLIVRELSYVGIGELLLKLEMLKVKLHQMGWFKKAHKKTLPRFPKRIGVVTSPTGAVIQDILHILSRRFSGFNLILNPVKVQGEGAAQEIAQAIEQMNRYQLADVIIVGRGGGSLEDLWAFNEEIVAQAIFHSQIPIISAVGHETDHCIADYVADVRAPTPSAAAEIVIAEKNQQLDYLSTIRKRIQQSLSHSIQQNQFRLKGLLRHSLFSQPNQLLEWRMQKLDDFRDDIDQSMRHFLQFKKRSLESKSQQATSLKPINQITHFKQHLGTLKKALEQAILRKVNLVRIQISGQGEVLDQIWHNKHLNRKHLFQSQRYQQELIQNFQDRIALKKQRLAYISDLLKALDPKSLLKKGYSILFAKKDQSIIKSVSELEKGEQARLLLSDGEVMITINEFLR